MNAWLQDFIVLKTMPIELIRVIWEGNLNLFILESPTETENIHYMHIPTTTYIRNEIMASLKKYKDEKHRNFKFLAEDEGTSLIQ